MSAISWRKKSKISTIFCGVLLLICAMASMVCISRVVDKNFVNRDGSVTIEVDYDRPIENLIKKGGYSFFDERINETNFPVGNKEKSKKEVCFKVFHFNHYVQFGDVVIKMEEEGYRPAGLRELLAYGEADSSRPVTWLVALGAIWKDSNGYNVVVIADDVHYRVLMIESDDMNRDSSYTFLGCK